VGKLQTPGMQKHSLQTLFLKYFVPFEITVFIVTGNGVPL
jgi:hypothetical protein